MRAKSLNLLARLGGFEPPTYGLEVRCSILLSYRRFGGKTLTPIPFVLQAIPHTYRLEVVGTGKGNLNACFKIPPPPHYYRGAQGEFIPPPRLRP